MVLQDLSYRKGEGDNFIIALCCHSIRGNSAIPKSIKIFTILKLMQKHKNASASYVLKPHLESNPLPEYWVLLHVAILWYK